MNKTIEELREKGEIASEQGDQEQALFAFDQAFLLALKEKDYAAAINLLGHHLHIYKVYYQESQDDTFMELLLMDTEIGKRIAKQHDVSGQPLSVMYLRAGDYYLFKKDFSAATNEYKSALEELAKAENIAPETTAEYMGHYGVALVKSGSADDGFTLFDDALNVLEKNNTIREFHHMIIHSGLLLRQAECYRSTNEIEKAKASLEKAAQIAKELAEKHKMRMRLDQAELFKKALT
jgi:tetratricopeptide (TPR) repeat protein